MADDSPTPRKCANEGCGGTKFPWASAPTCNKCYHKETREWKRKADFEGYRLQVRLALTG